ncbi:MAG: hypothetical protein ACFFDH_18610 [Promethearchaeota archaeon]
MKKNKMIVLAIITTMIIGVTGYVVAHPTEIVDFTGANHVSNGCHGTNGLASSGTLQVSTSTSGNLITLTTTIQGFTDALPTNNNRSGTFSIGIPYYLGDNREFGLGIAQNTVNGETNYWGIGIWEVELNSNGNTVNPLKFRVLAPEADGTYNLIVAVINGANTTGDEQSIIYMHKIISVTVTGGSITIASLTMIFPLNNIFLYATFGILGTGMIIFVFKRRKLDKIN